MARHRRRVTQGVQRFASPLRVRADDGKSKRTLTFTIASERAASDGGVVLMSGADLTGYRENPIVLLGHDHSKPIGSCVDLSYDAKAKTLSATVELAPDEALPEDAKRQLAFMRHFGFGAASIGFRVTDIDWSPSKDERAAYGVPDGGWIARAWTLHEWSIVTVPADQSALLKNSAESLALCRAAASSALESFRNDASEEPRMDGMEDEDKEKPEGDMEEEQAMDDAEMGDDMPAEDDGGEEDAMAMLSDKLDALIDGVAALTAKLDAMTGEKAMDEEPAEDEPAPEEDDEDAMSEDERNTAEALRVFSASVETVNKALTGGSARK